MSSKMRIPKICQFCGKEFIAQKTTTKFCCPPCASRAYKARKRAEKIAAATYTPEKTREELLEEIKHKEVLKVSEAALLMNCSKRAVYHMINDGRLPAAKLSPRKTVVRRADIEAFYTPQFPPTTDFPLEACYSLTHVREKFGVSEGGLYQMVIKNNIPKRQVGKEIYVPKTFIDELFNPDFNAK